MVVVLILVSVAFGWVVSSVGGRVDSNEHELK